MHFIWMRAGKHNFAEPAVYGAVIALLLGWRAARRLAPSAAGSAKGAGGPSGTSKSQP
jgi:sulfoxide reductase heme-binding subunit YedZ